MSIHPIRVLLVEDHPEVSKRIAMRLAHETDIELAGRVSISDDVVDLIDRTSPDILLIDPINEQASGMMTLDEIRAHTPDLHIVVLTAVVDTSLKIELNKLGVHNILEKGIDSDALIYALRNMINGK